MEILCEQLSNDFEEMRSKGNEQFKNKNFNEAELFYKQAHSLDPTNAKILSNLAACLIALKRVDEALVYACLCIKSDPKWSKGYYRKARAHELLEEFELEYVNAIKCAFYEPEFYQELHGIFKSNKLTIQDFCIVKNSIEINSKLKSLYQQSVYSNVFEKLKIQESVTIFVINSCEITIDQPLINQNIIFVGIGDKAKIIDSPLFILNSKCVFSNLNFESEKLTNHLLFAKENSKIFFSDCSFKSVGKESLASICIADSSCLKMLDSNVNESNEAGILITDKSKCDLKNCNVFHAGISLGSGIEIRYGSEAIIDSCSIDSCAKGILIWHDPANVLVTNSVISNNRSEGILVSFNPDQPYNKLKDANKTNRALTKILNNKIFSNSAFGITADEHSNVIVSKNEIYNNGNSGIIVKGNLVVISNILKL